MHAPLAVFSIPDSEKGISAAYTRISCRVNHVAEAPAADCRFPISRVQDGYGKEPTLENVKSNNSFFDGKVLVLCVIKMG